jgi:large subunit ribosomal protein L35
MKLRSHSSTKKRVKITGRGKLKLRKSAKKHLLAQKSKRQKKVHKYGKSTTLKNERNLRRMLPYAK